MLDLQLVPGCGAHMVRGADTDGVQRISLRSAGTWDAAILAQAISRAPETPE